MAKHTIAAGARAAHNKTLATAIVDSVSVPGDQKLIEIVKGTGPAIYFTLDGTEPTVGGTNTYVLPEGACVREIAHDDSTPVKLISSGTPTYSVTVLA